ncbi:FAD-dependent monooxygenase [Shigella flexneri]
MIRRSRSAGVGYVWCEPTGKKVAIIGAGPAGLACADVLTRNGVKPLSSTVIQKLAGCSHLRYSGLQAGKGGNDASP